MGDAAGSKRPNKQQGGGADKKQKKQYIPGRGRGMFKERQFKGLRFAGFERFRATGVKGVMISCDVRSETMCQSEMVMAMTDEAKELYPKLFEDKEKEEDAPKKDVDDIEAAIAAENQEEKDEKAAIFAYIRTEVKGLIFVETKGEGMDPIAMVQGFIKRVHETGHSKTKYAVRMQPIVATCYAGYDDICKTIKPVLDQYLGKDTPAKKYSILFKKRSNTDMDRLELVKKVADLVDKKHSVDLTCPDRCITIDILTNACLIGIADDYFKLRKFNIMELTGTNPQGKGRAAAFDGGRVAGDKKEGGDKVAEGGKAGGDKKEEEGAGGDKK